MPLPTIGRNWQTGLMALAALLAGVLGFWFNAQRLVPDQHADAAAALWRAELRDLQGQRFNMESLKGRPLVVNFWASWCGPCIEEMPDFQRASQTTVGKKATFIGIGIDSAEKMRPFADKLGITYLLLESGAQGLDLVRATGNRAGALPFTLILDAKGGVTVSKLGKLDYAELTQILSSL